MKKILMLLLVCTLVFSLTFTMTSCKLLDGLFGDTQEEPEQPDNGGNGDKPGTGDEGVESEDTNIFDGGNNGGGSIDLPIIDVNSTDMTQPEGGEGAEEGTEETPDAE